MGLVGHAKKFSAFDWHAVSYNLADLHIHSFCSDGLRTPTDAVSEAHEAGVRFLSLTDHDSVEGVDEAMEAGERYGIGVIPGAELSAHFYTREVHLLAYFFDHHHPTMADYVGKFRRCRYDRGVAMVECLNKLGIAITVEQVMSHATSGLVGRPHIAAAMVGIGAVSSKEEAFDKYIGDGGPAMVPKSRSEAVDVISMVHLLGGVVVLAHPGNGWPEQILVQLVEAGLDGIEVFHPSHQPTHIEHYSRLAAQYGLLLSGGSDSHGEESGSRIGDCGIGCEAIEALKARAATYA